MSRGYATRQFGFELVGRRLAVAAMLSVIVSAAMNISVRAEAMTPEIEEKSKHAAVMVILAHSKRKEGDTILGFGSGFFVNRTGLAITNNHVVDPGHKQPPNVKWAQKRSLNRLVWTVVTDGGTEDEKEWKSDVVYQNEQADIAVLQVRDENGEFLETPHFLEFYPSDSVDVGYRAWCFGFPGGDSRKGNVGDHARVTKTWGNITMMERTPSGRLKMIRTDVLANPGNSGGPFVNDDGELIGVLTLGHQVEGEVNTTRLVPADLVHEMIQTAFRRGKVPFDVDLRPFYKLFLTSEHVWDFPMFDREKDRDCITVDGGARICGTVAGETVTWPTPLGKIEIPTSSMAYILAEEDRMIALVEGGDILPFDPDEAKLMFSPPGGDPREVPLDEVKHISFRTRKKKVDLPSEKSYVLGGNGLRLSLQDVQGKVSFEDEIFGEVEIPATDIQSVEGDFDVVLSTSAGSRMTGSFMPHTLQGKLSWCDGREVKFSFEDIEEGRFDVRTIDYAERAKVTEITLEETIQTVDDRLLRIAKALDKNALDDAGAMTRVLMDGETYRSLTEEKQQQLTFLHGELMFRTGKFQDSYTVFRKLGKDSTKIPNVRYSAQARMALLDEFENGVVNGASLSEEATFEHASRELAESYTKEARLTIETLETTQAEKRSEYNKLLKRAEEAEEKLRISSRLTAGQPEEYLVRLWRAMANLHTGELRRMQVEQQEVNEQLRNRNQRRGGGRMERMLNLKLERIERDREKANAGIQEARSKIEDAGFIIDDPNREEE